MSAVLLKTLKPRAALSTCFVWRKAGIASEAEQGDVVRESTHTQTQHKKVFRLPAEAKYSHQYEQYLSTSGVADNHKYSHYPGASLTKPVKPPTQLINAAIKLLKRFPVNNLEDESAKLRRHLWNRQLPIDDRELNKRAQMLGNKLLTRSLQKTNTDDLSQEDVERHLETVRRKMITQLKKKVYHWTPLDMDPVTSLTYMSGYILSNYTILHNIMYEISQMDPEFKPISLLDFGSGLATSVWASNHIWRDSITEHYCWDKSGDVCTLARLILQDGQDHRDMLYPGVYFRQQLERRESNQSAGFDVVVCAHTLFELPDQKTRLEHIDRLWNQTNKYLIIADNGTVHGHHLIEEARMHILENYGGEGEHQASVFSPCPHDMPCPRTSIASNRQIPCAFEASYTLQHANKDGLLFQLASPESKNKSSRVKRGTYVRYSYVVLRKGEVASRDRSPRVLNQPMKNSKSCMQCHLCFSDGQARLTNVHKLTNKPVFKVLKRCQWGSRLPIVDWQSISQQHQPVEEGEETTTNLSNEAEELSSYTEELSAHEELSDHDKHTRHESDNTPDNQNDHIDLEIHVDDIISVEPPPHAQLDIEQTSQTCTCSGPTHCQKT